MFKHQLSIPSQNLCQVVLDVFVTCLSCKALTLNHDVGYTCMSSQRSTGTFCHVIFYQLNHVTKTSYTT